MAHSIAWMPYWREVALHERIAALKARKPAPAPLQPIFDMLPELPGQIVDAVYSGADKVRQDKDAEAFTVAVKISGAVHPEDLRFRMETENAVKCEVKSCMFEAKDKSAAPVDRYGRVIPPNERALHTPLGQYLNDGAPDAVIKSKAAA